MTGRAAWIALVATVTTFVGLMGATCIMEPAELTVSAGADVTITLGASHTLQGSAQTSLESQNPVTYAWTPTAGLSDPTRTNPVFTPTAAGTYTLTFTVTDALGNSGSDTVTITVVASSNPLMANAGPDLVVGLGSTVTLQGSATGGTGTYFYEWQPSTGLSSNQSARPTFTPSQLGSFTFTLTVTDSEGVRSSDTVVVTAVQSAGLSSITWGANSTSGYTVIASFDQALDPISAQNVANYRIHGTTTTPDSATLSADNQTVTLVFDGPLSTSTTFDLSVSNGLKSATGAAVSALSNRAPAVNSLDTTRPTVASRVWGNGETSYQVIVTFSEVVDNTTATALANYTLAGNSGADSRLPTSAVLDETGRVVTLTFSTTTSGFRTADTLTVAASVRDINSLSVNTASTAAVTANSADTTGPTIASRAWGDSQTTYQVAVTFSEVLDRASAVTLGNYTLGGHTATVAALDATGRTVNLTFGTTTNGFAVTDTLTVSSGVKDINGRANTSTAATAPDANTNDSDGPAISSRVWGNGQTTYLLTVTFNEVLDRASATTAANYKVANVAATGATLDATGRIVTLTFAASASGFAVTDTLTVAAAVKDINGQATSSTAAATPTANADDTTSPTIATRTWASGGTNYQAVVTFSEVLDRASATTLTNYSLAGNAGADIRNPTAAALDTTGRVVTLTFGSTTNGLRTADTLTVNNSVLDINGRANTSTAATAMAVNAADTTGPTIASRKWASNGSTYQAVVTFSEVLERTQALTAANYTLDGVVGANPTLDTTGKIVTVTFAGPADGFETTDTLTVTNAITDINGQANTSIAATAMEDNTADTTVPTITSRIWAANATSYQAIVTFSETLRGSVATAVGNYSLAGSAATAAALDSAGKVVTVTFGSTNGHTLSAQLTATNAITDINGGANASTAALAMGDNTADVTAPTVTSATETGANEVTVLFNEVLDKTTAETESHYRNTTDGADPTSAVLQNDGRTVILTFGAAVDGDTIRVSVGNSILDVNGNAKAQEDFAGI